MTLSKKEKLIRSLKKLQMKELDSRIRSLESRDFSKEADLNATLTQIVYDNFLSVYPEIMNNPNKQALEQFCKQEIGPIKSELKPSPAKR